MPKYLLEADYTAEGLKGLAKDKAAGRVKAVNQAVAALGGSVEAFYFAFGDRDVIVIVIVDLPDNASAAALALAVASSGSVNLRTTVLLTPEEVDKALKVKTGYRAPGKGK